MQAVENKPGVQSGDVEYATPNTSVIDLSNDNELAKRVGNLKETPKYKVIQQYIFENLGGNSVVLSDGVLSLTQEKSFCLIRV